MTTKGTAEKGTVSKLKDFGANSNPLALPFPMPVELSLFNRTPVVVNPLLSEPVPTICGRSGNPSLLQNWEYHRRFAMPDFAIAPWPLFVTGPPPSASERFYWLSPAQANGLLEGKSGLLTVQSR